MNYSRNLNRKAMIKRLILSWVIVATITALISGAIGFIVGINAHASDIEAITEFEPVMIINIEEPPETTEVEPEWVSLGTFQLTAYCDCRKCNGKWYGYPTAAGTEYVEGRTIAVWKNQIPLGSKVVINGHEYIAEDTGTAIKANCIDVYLDSHERAIQFGIQYAEVFVRR